MFASIAAWIHYSYMSRADGELIPTRASLLYRMRDLEDGTSWNDFFSIYWKLIYGVARNAGLTDAEAQDVVQETMTSVAKNMPAFRYDPAIGSFKAWLLKLTRWRIVSQFRKRPPREAHVALPHDPATHTDALHRIADPTAGVLDSMWDDEWEKNLLKAAVDKIKRRLDPAKYQIFDFYVNKEWPAEKVAMTFRVPVGQVYLIKNRVTVLIKREVRRLEKEMT